MSKSSTIVIVLAAIWPVLCSPLLFLNYNLWESMRSINDTIDLLGQYGIQIVIGHLLAYCFFPLIFLIISAKNRPIDKSIPSIVLVCAILAWLQQIFFRSLSASLGHLECGDNCVGIIPLSQDKIYTIITACVLLLAGTSIYLLSRRYTSSE